MAKLINPEIRKIYDKLAEVIGRLHQLTLEIRNEELQATMHDLRSRMNDPFMFVIVGEVKAGKSSFINALLESDTEITETGVAPVTDVINQIVYGEKEEIVVINEHLKKVYRPIPILEDIAIVDTPGTNTIIEHHQEITERFIPMADLIVFVFDAKNPYRKSAWDFFDFIQKEWHKKIIFILQQKDLMSDSDLEINITGLRDYAEKNGVENPRIFAVSAKMEQESAENSGFLPLREWISGNITGGQAPYLKLENILKVSHTMLDKIGHGIKDRSAQLEVDKKFMAGIEKTLTDQESKSKTSVDKLISSLLDGYNRIALEKRNDINDDLGFFTVVGRSFASIFSKKSSPKEKLSGHLEDLERKLSDYWSRKLEDGINDLADNIKLMIQNVEHQLEKSETILKNDHEIFSNIAERRHKVLDELQSTFYEFKSSTESYVDNSIVDDSRQIAASITAGSGLAVVGIILSVVTQLTVFDITGGVLTTLGVALAGITLSMRKRKILKTYDQEIKKGEEKLQDELSKTLIHYISTIKSRVNGNFKNFEEHIDREEKAVQALEEISAGLYEKMELIGNEISSTKPN